MGYRFTRPTGRGTKMRKQKNPYYLSNEDEQMTCYITGLALDELESIVGRFRRDSFRAGMLRGMLSTTKNGTICIRHHMTKKILWIKEEQ